jgi:superfamily II DNA/RNA helicase
MLPVSLSPDNLGLSQAYDLLLQTCRHYAKHEFFVKYVLNSVLSYLEEKEQDLILGMRYDEWIKIHKDTVKEIKERIVKNLAKLIYACNSETAGDVEDNLRTLVSNSDVVERSLCYLYLFGIYDDCISRYILIRTYNKQVPDYTFYHNATYDQNNACKEAQKVFPQCVKVLQDALDNGFDVRTRFIEIAKDLYLVKQRFPNKSIFESYLLVDRVFAYAYPRELPIGRHRPEELCQGLENTARQFFDAYHQYLGILCHKVEEEFKDYWDIFCRFINSVGIELYYSFQKNGIRRALEKLRKTLSEKEPDYLVIQAPTGSGKTEIMLYTIILAALARKIILHKHELERYEANTPVALIIYPRRALANDQVSRLVKYLQVINTHLKDRRLPPITVTIRYTEIRSKEEIESRLPKAFEELKDAASNEVELALPHGVKAYLVQEGKHAFVELRFMTCPDGTSFPRLRVLDNGKIDETVLCGSTKLDFIALTRKSTYGDVHITLFETLRSHLLSGVRTLFGVKRGNIFDHPIIVALDEIHTYTDIPGVRYAFMIKRVLNKIRWQRQKALKNTSAGFGTLVMGMSATIPKPHEFLSALFMDRRINEKTVKDYLVEVEEDEKIPLGTEYFFIAVPTRRAPVDALSVSIQTLMTTFYNIPSLSKNGKYAKKAIIFVDELNVLHRLKKELYDPPNFESGAIKRKYNERYIGLQDFRNPYFSDLFNLTMSELNDDKNVIDAIRKGYISSVALTNSWKYGELWWGYMLDSFINNSRDTTIFNEVIEFSSRHRGNINEAHIIVSTSSLEVGVDYSDVVLIYQHGAPKTLSALIQRAGRAGRRVYENPLMRIIVGVQLSPDIPHQANLFELFTTAQGKLRDLVNYDTMFLPTKKSKEIHKQLLVELLLEYYVLNKENRKEILSGRWDECEVLGLNYDKVKSYISYIFGEIYNEQELEYLYQQVMNELSERLQCQS